jgi:hypothetical protein
VTETKENDDINVTLKNMVAAMQKELKGFGHQQNKEEREEILRHIKTITLGRKVN